MFRYPVIIEKTENNYSAYSPDLPGCVATGHTISETVFRMREAIQFHIKGMEDDGLPIPEPLTKVKYIEVTV